MRTEANRLGGDPSQDPIIRARGALRRLLIVDDEPLVRATLRILLESTGYEVLEAADGLSAIAQCRAHADELVGVLLDLGLPGTSGAAVFREIRTIRSDMPVLISSGRDVESIAAELRYAPGVRILPKPFRLEELEAWLRSQG